jgi:hypothetical protein
VEGSLDGFGLSEAFGCCIGISVPFCAFGRRLDEFDRLGKLSRLVGFGCITAFLVSWDS